MSIKRLIANIGKMNLADGVDEDVLMTIGSRVKRQYEEDFASMADWREGVEKGIELMRQEYSGKSYPWEGASNYKDPILTEASTVFGDKASLELLRGKDLVSAEVIGKDPRGEKKVICERIMDAMNYQVNHDMDGWRDDQERLFYCLPVVGTVFKKVLYNPLEKKCESVVVNYPDFVINQATKSMAKCRSFSHVLDFSESDVEERVRCGKWLDPRPNPDSKASDKEGDEGSNEKEGVIDALENPMKYIEMQTYYDLDEDNYEEPLTITIQHSTGKVVRIQPRYDERSIIIATGEGDEKQYRPAFDVLEEEKAKQVQEFGGEGVIELVGIQTPEIDPDQYELIKVDPLVNVVKYGFITSPDNTFLDLGYSHLLGALAMNINTTTNQINDRTTLNILGGGWLAKEFRVKQGFMRFRMGEYKQTEVPAEKLQQGIFPQPLQEPSQTAYQMRTEMQQRASGFLAVVDVSGKIQATTAPTTALAIIQEAIIPTTALFKRILSAESKEFQILFKINQLSFPKDKYQMILDDEQADPRVDFNYDGMDIVPTANAEMSSKMHRIQTATLEMEQVPLVLQMGGNPVPIVTNFFDAIGSTLIDKIFPDDGSMSPADKKIQEQMLAAQKQQAEAAAFQAQVLGREQDRLDKETEVKIAGLEEDRAKALAEVEKIRAETAKIIEEIQTESLKNKEAGSSVDVESRTIEFDEKLKTQAFNNDSVIKEREHYMGLEKAKKEIEKVEAEVKLIQEKANTEKVKQSVVKEESEVKKKMVQKEPVVVEEKKPVRKRVKIKEFDPKAGKIK